MQVPWKDLQALTEAQGSLSHLQVFHLPGNILKTDKKDLCQGKDCHYTVL